MSRLVFVWTVKMVNPIYKAAFRSRLTFIEIYERVDPKFSNFEHFNSALGGEKGGEGLNFQPLFTVCIAMSLNFISVR